jgi:hypothetical protein
MKDRQPTRPGRVKITPENGAAYYAVMEMADEPTEVGTPPTKANLLKDTTAAMFGGDENMVPDDALVMLKTAIDGFSDVARIETGTYIGTGTVSHTINFSFTPRLVILYCIPFVWSGSGTYNYELAEYLEFYFQNATSISVYNGSGAQTTTYSISNNQLTRNFSYENTYESRFICNTKNKKYGYIAIC